MHSIFDDPGYWNMRASEVVTRLALVTGKAERGMLLRLHEDYVRLASAAMVRAGCRAIARPLLAGRALALEKGALANRLNARHRQTDRSHPVPLNRLRKSAAAA
jgi:hypothetical protein